MARTIMTVIPVMIASIGALITPAVVAVAMGIAVISVTMPPIPYTP
jgi:hypothetical protein